MTEDMLLEQQAALAALGKNPSPPPPLPLSHSPAFSPCSLQLCWRALWLPQMM